MSAPPSCARELLWKWSLHFCRLGLQWQTWLKRGIPNMIVGQAALLRKWTLPLHVCAGFAREKCVFFLAWSANVRLLSILVSQDDFDIASCRRKALVTYRMACGSLLSSLSEVFNVHGVKRLRSSPLLLRRETHSTKAKSDTSYVCLPERQHSKKIFG